MNLKNLITALILLIGFQCIAQNNDPKYVGTYSDRKGIAASDILILMENGTFKFTTLDPELGGIENFTTNGNWINEDNEIILNPQKEQRELSSEILKESTDSSNQQFLTLKLEYILHEYKKEAFFRKRKYNFDGIRFFINGSNKMYLAKRNPTKSNHLKIQPDNTIKLDKLKYNIHQITKIAFTFIDNRQQGFRVLYPQNTLSNHIQIEVNHHLDVERTPRSRRILIKGKKAYIFSYSNGVIDTSVFSIKLKKRK